MNKIFSLYKGIKFRKKACRADTESFTKNDISPNLTLYCLAKGSLYFSLRDIIALMSTSLNVVNIAVVCWASTNLSAMTLRMRDIFFLVVRPCSWGSFSFETSVALTGIKGGGSDISRENSFKKDSFG